MAQYAYTFTSGDVVTPTKLNNARTVSEIVNADIKSDAAIAGTKIAPDFGSQNVVTSGTVGPASNSTSAFVGARSSTDANPADLIFEKSRGTLTSKTVVAAGDVLGRVRMFGYDGSAMVEGASIQAIIDGTPGAGDMPTRLSFRTTADGASSTTERMRITEAGNVGIANAAPTEKLHVTGNIKASGYIDADTSFRGQSSDSAAAPSFTWTDDTNTGMFRPAADALAFCEGGVEAMRISSSGQVGIGTTSPSYKLDVAGIIHTSSNYAVDGVQVVGNRRTGWTAPTGTATRATFDSGTVTLSQLAARVHALIDDLAAHGLIDS